MEEKSQSQLSQTISSWKLKQEVLKNQRNYRQLENRLIILEMERQGKIKSIQKKLQTHKKLMEVRMDRFKLKQSLEKCEKNIDQNANSNSRIFKELRLTRAVNIRSRSNQLRQQNTRLFRQIKQQRQDNEKSIKIQAQKQLELKADKRNKVRLLEIESKEKVDKFWNHRLSSFKSMKQNEMHRQISMEQKKMQWIMNLQRNEQKILDQIKKTEEMETQILSMMAEEKSMISVAVCNRL